MLVYDMNVFEPKWINSYYIWHRVNSFMIEVLHIPIECCHADLGPCLKLIRDLSNVSITLSTLETVAFVYFSVKDIWDELNKKSCFLKFSFMIFPLCNEKLK